MARCWHPCPSQRPKVPEALEVLEAGRVRGRCARRGPSKSLTLREQRNSCWLVGHVGLSELTGPAPFTCLPPFFPAGNVAGGGVGVRRSDKVGAGSAARLAAARVGGAGKRGNGLSL